MPTTVATASRSLTFFGPLLFAVGATFLLAPPPVAALDVVPVASFAPVVKQVAPSVVTVSTSRQAKHTAHVPEKMRRFMDPDQRFGPEGMFKEQGQGSGVIVSPDGYILTNNHVVEEADEITVTLASGHGKFTAKLIGTDPKSDIAVLKIDAGKTLPALPFGDSDRSEVGDVVLAIGNPFGVGQTVTSGIISARGRGVGLTDYEDYIQTDASINPGNSGGALVDASGKLIGINTAILSPSGGNLGIGFAVPVNQARGIMTSLMNSGKVVRGYLGVMIQPLTPELTKALKLANEDGVLVGDVVEDGPAGKAGVKPGDVVVAFNGQPVTDPRNLRLKASQTVPGTKATLTVMRDGKEQRLDLTVQELPGGEVAAGHEPAGKAVGSKARLGVRLADLDVESRERFDVPRHVKGALIAEVLPGSRAATVGLKPGEVIVEVDRKAVKTAADVSAAVAENDGDLVLRVWSKASIRFVAVPAGPASEVK